MAVIINVIMPTPHHCLVLMVQHALVIVSVNVTLKATVLIIIAIVIQPKHPFHELALVAQSLYLLI